MQSPTPLVLNEELVRYDPVMSQFFGQLSNYRDAEQLDSCRLSAFTNHLVAELPLV